MSDPIDQEKETVAGMVVAGSGIQVDRRTGRGMGMSLADQVGDMQFRERMGKGDGDELGISGKVNSTGG